MGYSLLQLSTEEEIEVRSCLAAIEIEERREEIERKESELQGKEEKLKQKAKEILKLSNRGQAGGCPVATNGRAARQLR